MGMAHRWLGRLLVGALALTAATTQAQSAQPESAQPEGAQPESAQPRPTLPPPAPMRVPVGEVTEVQRRQLILDRGSRHGLARGDSVEIATREGSVVVRVIVALPDSARTERPLGVEVEEGAAFRLTAARPTVHRTTPARASYFSLDTRVFGVPSVNDNDGGAVLADVRLRYRLRLPLELQLRLSPIGFGAGPMGRIGVGHGEAGLGYDHRLFGFGVSLGATVTEVEDREAFTGFRTTLGVSTGVSLRLGARDGLHAEIGVSYGYTPNGFEWVYARFDGAVPLKSGFWLVITASGGRTRHGMGAIGFRALLRGAGGPGSLLLTGYFGGAGVLRPSVFESYAGPLLGLGLEARY